MLLKILLLDLPFVLASQLSLLGSYHILNFNLVITLHLGYLISVLFNLVDHKLLIGMIFNNTVYLFRPEFILFLLGYLDLLNFLVVLILYPSLHRIR